MDEVVAKIESLYYEQHLYPSEWCELRQILAKYAIDAVHDSKVRKEAEEILASAS